MSGEENTPGSKAVAPQCQFFVQRKKRLCRMTVKPGRQYCGEHEPQPKTEAGQVDKRIPCPNDPKHTCYASKLLKHLAICNARRTEQPPYIVENINAPEAVETCPRLPLSSYPKDVLANVIDKVNHLYAKHVEGHITTEPLSPTHRAVLPEFSAPDRADSSLRHLRQVSALLWSAERAPLPAPRTCYVELGAGKGQLSYYAAHAWCAGTGSRVLAVDRAPLRHKRDNKLRSTPPTQQTENTKQTDQQDLSDTYTTEAVNVNMGTDNQHNLNINNDTNVQNQSDSTSQSNGRVSNADGNSSDDRNTPVDNINVHTLERRISNNPNENYRINASNKTHSETHYSDVADSLKGSTENTDKIDSDEVMKDGKDKNRNSESGDGESVSKGESGVAAPGGGGNGTERSAENGDEVAVRLRADLAHLALEAVPVVAESAAVVGLAKHLCGVATDYALRCIAAPGVVSKTRGLVVATCCHHRVERAPYVATQLLQELGINAEEFNIMLGIVSWATCGDGRSRERRLAGAARAGGEAGRRQAGGEAGRRQAGGEAGRRQAGGEAGRRQAGGEAGRRQAEREATGRRAKALLDWGRVLWLRARGLDARLCYYVPRDVSLENVAIVAVRRTL